MLLLRHEELCVCEFTHAIGVAQPTISRSLAQLRELGLVLDRREGLWIHYSLDPSIPAWVKGLLNEFFQGNEEVSPFIDDEKTLSSMPNRPGAPRCV